MQVAKVNVPPPAPSPPQSHPPPVNVFDFLVSERSPAASDRSLSASPAGSAQRRASHSSVSSESSESSLAASRSAHNQSKHSEIVYGSDPVPTSLHKYASDVSIPMDHESQASQGHSAPVARTPAPRQVQHVKSSVQTGSEKKRKRPQVEELDLSDAKHSDELSDSHAALHTGLTGGLGKLLAGSDARRDEASPLNPKKRSRPTREAGHARESGSRSLQHRTDSHADRHEPRRKHAQRQHHDNTRARQKAIEAVPTPRAITAGPPTRSSFGSHSEFFLSLVDKDHKSRKGQSIWGALKTFHEGLCDADEQDQYEVNGQKLHEEKRLLRALRVKRNKHGEVVLFARPDYELAEEIESVKRIEAP